jgi:hypothetical protein
MELDVVTYTLPSSGALGLAAVEKARSAVSRLFTPHGADTLRFALAAARRARGAVSAAPGA